MCSEALFEEGNKHSRPSHFRAKSTHAKRKKRTKKRERERERGTERDERQRSLVVLVVRRKRRSLLFFDRKKKKKWNKIVSAIGILAVGGKRISRIISRLVAFTASFETEKAERERTKNRY